MSTAHCSGYEYLDKVTDEMDTEFYYQKADPEAMGPIIIKIMVEGTILLESGMAGHKCS